MSAIILSTLQPQSATQPLQAEGTQLSMQWVQEFTPVKHALAVHFEAVDGAGSFQGHDVIGLGTPCLATVCVSDSSVMVPVGLGAESLIDSALVGTAAIQGVHHTMDDHGRLLDISHELTAISPQLKAALAGSLGAAEISQLIADVQAQLLELNAIGGDYFGELAAAVDQEAAELASLGNEELLASMGIDSTVLSDSAAIGGDVGLGLATLDGLFTSPESFPLTMDFSNPVSVYEANELFASVSGSSSISSTATSGDSDSGAVSPTGSDFPGA